MPTATHYALFTLVVLGVTFALALITLILPSRLHLAFSLLVALVALGTFGSFEFVREAIRKPYVIGNYLYANSLYSKPMPGDGGFTVERIDDAGILTTAKWLQDRTISKDNEEAVGREIFRVECQSCHTTDVYRGVRKYLVQRQWNRDTIFAMLNALDSMHNGVMPPFAGKDDERSALAAFLSTLSPVPPVTGEPAASAPDGQTVFERDCSMCHQIRPEDSVFSKLPRDSQKANDALKDLPGLFPGMPNLKLRDEQRTALVQWVNARRNVPAPGAAEGGK
jgi:mono/diheme cytochrome c family protein